MPEFNIENLPVKITYVSETMLDDWQCDHWSVEISHNNARGNGMFRTDYYTGLGNRTKPNQSWIAPKQIKPKIADVLHSLFLDASAADYNFDDWCDTYGYSNDSIKALNSYKECLQTATMLRKCFDSETREKIESIISEM